MVYLGGTSWICSAVLLMGCTSLSTCRLVPFMIYLLLTCAAVALWMSCMLPSTTCGSLVNCDVPKSITYASFVACGMGTTCGAVSFMDFGYLSVRFLVCVEIPCLTWGLSLMR